MTAAFDIGPTEHQPTFVSVDQEILRRSLATAEAAVEFIADALVIHDSDRGRTTMKNEAQAIDIEKHLSAAKSVVSELRSALGCRT